MHRRLWYGFRKLLGRPPPPPWVHELDRAQRRALARNLAEILESKRAYDRR